MNRTAQRQDAYGVRHPASGEPLDPVLERLVREIIGRVADRWTMLTLEVLAEHGRQRFGEVHERVGGVSQKVLTQTLRGMEQDGLVVRTVHAVVPPKVEYELTELGQGLGEAFCGVWKWAEKHRGEIEAARVRFAEEADARVRAASRWQQA